MNFVNFHKIFYVEQSQKRAYIRACLFMSNTFHTEHSQKDLMLERLHSIKKMVKHTLEIF